MEDIGKFTLSISRPYRPVLVRQVLEIDAGFGCAEMAGARDIDDAHEAWRAGLASGNHGRQ